MHAKMFLKFFSLSRRIHSQHALKRIVVEQLKKYFLRLESHLRALGSIKMIAGLNHRHHRHRHRHLRRTLNQPVLILLFQTRKLKIQAQVLQKALLTETRSTQWKSELWLRCQ